MQVKVIEECGYYAALFGIGLSYGHTSGKEVIDIQRDLELEARLRKIALGLCKRAQNEDNNAHCKFLRQMSVVVDIQAPLYWWPQMDQYRVSCTTQSESRMHTLLKNPITQDCFEHEISYEYMKILEDWRRSQRFIELVNALPQGWLQRRIWSANYETLRIICLQRTGHKLGEWAYFISEVKKGVKYPEFLEVENAV